VSLVSDSPTDAKEPQDAGSAPTIRVVITDDHAVVRRGLRQVLGQLVQSGTDGGGGGGDGRS
jgi:hypothetical protein